MMKVNFNGCVIFQLSRALRTFAALKSLYSSWTIYRYVLDLARDIDWKHGSVLSSMQLCHMWTSPLNRWIDCGKARIVCIIKPIACAKWILGKVLAKILTVTRRSQITSIHQDRLKYSGWFQFLTNTFRIVVVRKNNSIFLLAHEYTILAFFKSRSTYAKTTKRQE